MIWNNPSIDIIPTPYWYYSIYNVKCTWYSFYVDLISILTYCWYYSHLIFISFSSHVDFNDTFLLSSKLILIRPFEKISQMIKCQSKNWKLQFNINLHRINIDLNKLNLFTLPLSTSIGSCSCSLRHLKSNKNKLLKGERVRTGELKNQEGFRPFKAPQATWTINLFIYLWINKKGWSSHY